MTMKHRALTMLLLLAMVFTFMPVLVFADDAEDAKERTAVISNSEETINNYPVEVHSLADWRMERVNDVDADSFSNVIIYVAYRNGATTDLQFAIYKGDTLIKDWEDLTKFITEYGNYCTGQYDIRKHGAGTYRAVVREAGDHDVRAEESFKVAYHYYLTINGIRYQLNTGSDEDQAGVYGARDDLGEATILPTVTLSNGKTYNVVRIANMSYVRGITSVRIPASVTIIDPKAVGYYYDGNINEYVKIPDFVIYGKVGSAAQTYASENGFIFKEYEDTADDKTNEAVAALEWNGTPARIAKAKGVIVKAGKKKVSVSWTKPDKKKLKKFDKVEIQVCTDKSFARANTIRKEVKKSKKSVTIKGLAKKKTYYVRVRNVKGSGLTKRVGKWTTKKFKTK